MKQTRLFAAFLAVVLLSGPPTLAAPIAQWTFDETAGATAYDSIGGVDGILSGDATFVAGGVSGNAVSLSMAGAGLVNMGDHFRFDGEDFSVMAWVKLAPGDQTSMILLAKHRNAVIAGYILGINTGDGGWSRDDKAWFYDSNPSPGDEPVSTTSVNDGAWHQIVVTYSPVGLAEIYVDGAPAEDNKTSDVILSNNAPLLVGGTDIAGTPTNHFTGLVDDLQLYNHVLTSNEVQWLFEHPGQVVPEPSTASLLAIGGLTLLRRQQRCTHG